MHDLLRSTTLKLTLWYLAILMTISVSFSVLLYQVSSAELTRGLPPRGNYGRPLVTDIKQFEILRHERIAEGKMRLIRNLVVINTITLGLGGGISYLLARRTLQPIKEAVDAQGRFTSDASHELRTPLTVIQAEIEVALRDPQLSKSAMRALLGSNLEEVNKLRGLSDRLLQLSNEKDIRMESVSIESPAIEAMNRSLKTAQAKHIAIENTVAPLTIKGNADNIADMLSILLDNAIKYSPEKTTVTLSSEQHGRLAHIKVQDKGIGIKASDIPHIFDRFYRADLSRTSRQVNGYGLGLAIAKQIVQLHKGTIDVVSSIGGGTTFTVKLPLENPSASSQKI